MLKTFQYRLSATPAQETALCRTLEECRWLYNRLLEERRLAWAACAQSLSMYDQQNRLPALKEERPSLKTVHSQVLQLEAQELTLGSNH